MKRNKIMLVMLFFSLAIGLNQSYAQENDQQYTIALTSFFADNTPFIDEMAQLGFIEGENVTYLTFSFEGFGNENTTPEEYANEYNRQLQAMIDAGVDVFVTNTDTDAVNLKAMVGDTPIVFARSDDPVATGAVADLIIPGGTMTGTITNRPHERRLQILKEIKPDTDKVLYLYSPFTMEAESVLQQVLAVAETLGIEIIAIQTPDAITAIEALQTVPEGIDWIFMTPYVPFDISFTDAVTAISMAQGAGVSAVIDDISPLYLMGYGPNLAASDRQAARIVARILRGASPAEMPVEIAENYLTINLEAAEAIGLEIPVGILRQANRIMRPGDFDTTDTAGS
jgi:putative ABC transport system substrate-binding protein